MKRRLPVVLFALLIALLVACGQADGLPTQAGQYTVKSKSISFDGERYIFQWAPTNKSDLAWAKTREVRLQLDDKTFLEVDSGKKAVLHLTQEEPVTLVREERGSRYESAWYPYYAQPGTTIVVERERRQPIYVYPPTGSFNNGEQIVGGVRSDTAATPDQIKKMQATSNTVSGQSGGTGGGNAVTNKAGPAPATSGSSSAAPAAVATSAPSISTSGSTSPSGSAAKPAAPASGKAPSISTKKP